MRPINTIARDRLTAELRRQPPHAAAALAVRLGVSQPTLLRMLRERAGEVLRLGTTKNARYALRRGLRGNIAPIPVFRIDAAGRGDEVGALDLIAPAGALLDLAAWGWPVPGEGAPGWWDGLPYPLYDMQPQGFLGRNFARLRHQQLGVAADPRAWSDDDIVWVLSQCGSDVAGDLIVGEAAYQGWQQTRLHAEAPVSESRLPQHYAELAEQATRQGIAGSSVAGEFPKFAARRLLAGAGTPHVLVKFSGADASPAVQRWSDLLVCEHLALQVLAEQTGVAVAQSRILQSGGRCFLEVERFDRVGEAGRSPLVSLASLHAALLATATSRWPEIAAHLQRLGWLVAEDGERIALLWWFGQLIANSDMHLGNLSLRPHAGTAPRLALAPAYDMLPMHYAPLAGGEVAEREFSPALPLPRERAVWQKACRAALVFWQMASGDTRVSPVFRQVCVANAECLEGLAARV